MSVHAALARTWLAAGDYRRAEQELGRALEETPEDPSLHALLTHALIAQDRGPEALEVAERALALDAEHEELQVALGYALLATRRADEAEEVALRLLEKDPGGLVALELLARTCLASSSWADALEVAERGLELHPEDVELMQIAALARTQLGGRGASRAQLEAALLRDPENPVTHRLAGLDLLNRGDRDGALEHLREALRLDPEDPHTRNLYVEALKARSPLYAWFLRANLRLGAMPPRMQWGLILGAYIVMQLLRALTRSYPALLPWTAPVMILYGVLVFMSWFWSPIFDALLLARRDGRYALSPHRMRWTAAFAATFLLGLAVAGAGLALGIGDWVVYAMVFPLAALQFAQVPDSERREHKRLHAGWGVLVLVLALGGIALAPFDGEYGLRSMLLIIPAFLLGLLGTWLALGRVGRESRPAKRRR